MAKRKPRTPSQEPRLVRQDGGLCVTFANTASAKRTPIESYGDLLVWGQQTGALGAADGQRLGRVAGERPPAADAVFHQARELRDRFRRILLALADDEAPAAADLDALNDALGHVLANRRLVPAANGYRWDWGDRGGDDLDRMLWPVVLSMAEILTGRYRRRVGQCAGEGCDLLFVDRGPGSPRKWCDIKACGQRVRSHKHYHHTVKPNRIARQRARRRAALDPGSRT